MQPVGVVVEGATDIPAVDRLLAVCGLSMHPTRRIVTGGKTTFDRRLARYNAAAEHAPWFALRDADLDGGGCPATVRGQLLDPQRQASGLVLRLAVRALEAWLLADIVSFSAFFRVPVSRVPAFPDEHEHPKRALVDACRWSTRLAIRTSMAPRPGSKGIVGPGYSAELADYCRQAWSPDDARRRSPSLDRAFRDIEGKVAAGVWR